MSEQIPALPDERQVAKALHYLSSSDLEIARAKARLKAAEQRLKVAEAEGFLEAEGPQGERSAKARTTPYYLEALTEIEDATLERELVEAKRERAHLVIDVWRTLEASKRRA